VCVYIPPSGGCILLFEVIRNMKNIDIYTHAIYMLHLSLPSYEYFKCKELKISTLTF